MTEDRYSRSEGLFGAEGQRLIGQTKVTIAGLGGLGCHVSQQLAYLGVVDYRLVDPDLVTESSLNRVVGTTPSDVDLATKVAVAKRVITAIQPAAHVEDVEDWLESERGTLAIADSDVVFGCLDRDIHRIALIERCIASSVPLFDLATDADDRAGLTYEGNCAAQGVEPLDALRALIGVDGDVEAFWESVGSNLERGRIRMVFVADRIPAELRRIVEFLNEQMSPAEVVAVEVRQYVDPSSGLTSLVPRIVGNTAAAGRKKGDASSGSYVGRGQRVRADPRASRRRRVRRGAVNL